MSLSLYLSPLSLFNFVNVDLIYHVDGTSEFVSLHFCFLVAAPSRATGHSPLLNFHTLGLQLISLLVLNYQHILLFVHLTNFLN